MDLVKEEVFEYLVFTPQFILHHCYIHGASKVENYLSSGVCWSICNMTEGASPEPVRQVSIRFSPQKTPVAVMKMHAREGVH